MTDRRPRRIWQMALALALVASGACADNQVGDAPDAGATTTSFTTPASVPPLATYAPKGTTDIAFNSSFETASGYRYGLKVDLTLLPPEKNVLNSKPGFASIVREYDPSSTWTLTNELPDRTSRYNAVPGVNDFGVWGVFSVKRPICKAIKPKPRYYLTFSGGVGKGCALLLGYFNSEPAQSLVLAPGQATSGGFTVLGRVAHWYLADVPEAAVDAAISDLAAGPDATAVLLENALNPTGWQTPFLDGFDDSACLVESTGGIGGTTLLLFGYVGTSGVVASQERCGS